MRSRPALVHPACRHGPTRDACCVELVPPPEPEPASARQGEQRIWNDASEFGCALPQARVRIRTEQRLMQQRNPNAVAPRRRGPSNARARSCVSPASHTHTSLRALPGHARPCPTMPRQNRAPRPGALSAPRRVVIVFDCTLQMTQHQRAHELCLTVEIRPPRAMCSVFQILASSPSAHRFHRSGPLIRARHRRLACLICNSTTQS